MICTSCGKEVFGEARFCPNCAAPLTTATNTANADSPAASPVSSGPWPLDATQLTDLHTFEWRGECPSCKLVHTSENTSCPNDGSPRVVAFTDYRFGFYRYPVHAAGLACLNDCGMRTHHLSCSRCGSVIAGKYIKFKFPKKVRRAHVLLHSSVLLLTLLLVGFLATFLLKVSFGPSLMAWRFVQKSPQTSDMMVKFVAVVGISGFLAFLGILVLQYFRPFSRFNFAHIPRAAKKYAREEARSEAVKTAKATARATKDIGKPWLPGSQ